MHPKLDPTGLGAIIRASGSTFAGCGFFRVLVLLTCGV